jgi:type IV pilus assembly protein PilB
LTQPLRANPAVPELRVLGSRERAAKGNGPAPLTPELNLKADDQGQVGRRLGDLLVAAGLIAPAQLSQAVGEPKRTGEKLGAALLRLGFITEEQLVDVLARQYRIPVVKVPDGDIAPEILKLVPASVARKYEVIPIGRRSPTSLILATADPSNLLALDDVAFRTGLKVIQVLAPPSVIRGAIERCYELEAATLMNVLSEAEAVAERIAMSESHDRAGLSPHELRNSADQPPVVRLVNMILLDAINKAASDVHLEPDEGAFHVRFRVDGILQEVMTPPRQLEAALISRIKIMASLDIAERRLPQDGRIKFREGNREIDFRVSVLPSIFGESVVLRLLNKNALKLDLTHLGFDPRSLELFQKAIRSAHGMVVVTGPTGSGKTTTLYSALQTVNTPDVHILTLEDPVEYNLSRVTQIQVNEEIGLTFATALRSFLRHDPDIILVGEMRDGETAQIAVRAALTGHLVFSTLHTNDSPSAVARLVDMGIPPFLLASSLRLVVAQRLVRKICLECREPYEVSEGTLGTYGYAPRGVERYTVYKAQGCPTCNFTGVKGRIAIYEVMPVTREIRDLIIRGATPDEIAKVASDQGMKTLRESVLARVIEGVTTMDEALRVTTD